MKDIKRFSVSRIELRQWNLISGSKWIVLERIFNFGVLLLEYSMKILIGAATRTTGICEIFADY